MRAEFTSAGSLYLSVDDHRATFSSEEHLIYFGLNLCKML